MPDLFHLILRALPPVPSRPHWTDDVPAERRLRAALKHLLRHYRLEARWHLPCLAKPDPLAWIGWQRLADGSWLRRHAGVRPEIPLGLLLEEIDPSAAVVAVLPRNVEPNR